MPLTDLLQDPPALLAMEPEELAGYLLEHLNSLPAYEQERLHRGNFMGRLAYQAPQEIGRALTEAWIWLEREGLLAPHPWEQGDWRFITRRGKRLQNHVDVESFRRGNLLPRAQLHPTIAEAVWAEFIRGRYDTAVFNALREVEIAVRAAGGFTAAQYGVVLMRLAFDANNGPLRDAEALLGERDALSHLFAGAFGGFSNPARHREVGTDPVKAVEIITLASLLARIVDERAAGRAAAG